VELMTARHVAAHVVVEALATMCAVPGPWSLAAQCRGTCDACMLAAGRLPLGEPDTWEEDLNTDKAVRKAGGAGGAGGKGRKRKAKRKPKKAAAKKAPARAGAPAAASGRERGGAGAAARGAGGVRGGGGVRNGASGGMFARAGGGLFQVRG